MGGDILPGKKIFLGGLHPITLMSRKITEILQSIGYTYFDSPEIDSTENNFTLLNIPEGHSARSYQDTFYLSDTLVLRTHTSNTQIRVLRERFVEKELKAYTVGKVYRRDEDDFSHTHQFTQIEGFMVGKNISFAYLKGTLEFLLKEMFDNIDLIYRFRPSFFPFTNPSIEVDIKCIKCVGEGCSVCKQSGWVEVLGAGLIHTSVLKNCGYDVRKFSGLAFGLGVERLLMIKYGIEDIRCLYENDLRFLKQFVEGI